MLGDRALLKEVVVTLLYFLIDLLEIIFGELLALVVLVIELVNGQVEGVLHSVVS